MKLILELVSPMGNGCGKFGTPRNGFESLLFYVNVLFLLHNSLVLTGAKICFFVICFSIIPSQPLREKIVIHSVAFFGASDDVFLQQAFQGGLDRA